MPNYGDGLALTALAVMERDLDGGRQCFSQRLGGLWANDSDSQWIGSAILAIGAQQPWHAGRQDCGDAGAAPVHRSGAGFAATVFGFPDRHNLR